ncbi:hypothetical protein [Streptomyces liangshanensis]|uniref:Uncharacterized protein n=1 Tax=Streptomyces liangshanensis TaxID=2717324 RepID=A0A6G9H8I6_9ACTN|nr:hypothetical protein [Streptomyces liangshanensis]QIQ06559.1 hypothetical protein HA039_33415 [Streptomyces liangshanensis]
MSGAFGESVEQQAYLTRFLLEHTTVPLADRTFLRGVLPTRDAVRIVTGSADTGAEPAPVTYEFALLGDDGEPVTAPLVLGCVRTLAAGTPPASDESVMGMALVRVDTDAVEPAVPSLTDQALRVLRTLAQPYIEAPPSPALCGFLFTGPDTVRLYLAVEEADGLTAADVRLTGALTALLAALPSLLRETERWAADEADPHCSRTVDLTSW